MKTMTLEPAGPEKRATLENLFQLYVHDFTEQWWDLPRGELQENGLFEAYPEWDKYWREPNYVPLLIRADGHLAGFCLINDYSHSGRPIDVSIAEFFVARKHRRGGLGRAAALAVIGGRPGQWEIAVSRRNVGAQAFWRMVAAAAATGGEVEANDQDDERWNGLILRFRND